ncbi:glycerol-3-phosphate acyltransferase PlsX [Weissella uvarum]|uniref:phosphate acyltransferase PlsX n=1 Tax=Weissella uvarum TaxID=1479233 RepID=UPI00195F407A|nr:phosphate acyltransferase PlsX [Weissella uvarum]MBM7617757.1 glycerol-3-phosphate acyltransferase PlsX [Weissella uvarum]MCM0595864.1 phosphate acyltransferase PlsX [Weissella uvarum]
MFKIAVDAMGGDNAPKAIVAGVEKARDEMPNVEFQLYGPIDQVQPLVQNDQQIKLVQADEVIDMGEEPVKAMRTKKNSSLVLAAEAVKAGTADALFSAGNTGALLATGIFIVGRMKGIDRPALMALLPALKGPNSVFTMMDVGANAENKPNHLYQYGILGSFYANAVLGIENPRVGLLNNGGEEDKGDPMHKEAHQLLQKGSDAGHLNFVGNVESRDILQGPADVVVADGFSGNATLKALEGTAQAILSMLKHTILDGNLKTKLGGLMIKPALKDVVGQLDYAQYGGAVVIGTKAPVVKTHGSATPVEVANTMKQIEKILQADLTGKVAEFVKEHPEELSGKTDK